VKRGRSGRIRNLSAAEVPIVGGQPVVRLRHSKWTERRGPGTELGANGSVHAYGNSRGPNKRTPQDAEPGAPARRHELRHSTASHPNPRRTPLRWRPRLARTALSETGERGPGLTERVSRICPEPRNSDLAGARLRRHQNARSTRHELEGWHSQAEGRGFETRRPLSTQFHACAAFSVRTRRLRSWRYAPNCTRSPRGTTRTGQRAFSMTYWAAALIATRPCIAPACEPTTRRSTV
jgi:hypothetical protein